MQFAIELTGSGSCRGNFLTCISIAIYWNILVMSFRISECRTLAALPRIGIIEPALFAWNASCIIFVRLGTREAWRARERLPKANRALRTLQALESSTFIASLESDAFDGDFGQ